MTDWNDNAKAAARELAAYIGQSDKCERYLETFETKKTVADAVEWAKGVWGDYNYGYISYNPNTEQFSYTSSDVNRRWYIVCTRAEFDAYVKEQEGEKWTHENKLGIKCTLITDEPDKNGLVPTLRDCGGYYLQYLDNLKPIKPTLSESEAWRKVRDGHSVNFVMEEYNISEG